MIGAVVGEFVGADKGLGFLVNVGRGLYDTSLVFVAVFTLVCWRWFCTDQLSFWKVDCYPGKKGMVTNEKPPCILTPK